MKVGCSVGLLTPVFISCRTFSVLCESLWRDRTEDHSVDVVWLSFDVLVHKILKIFRRVVFVCLCVL